MKSINELLNETIEKETTTHQETSAQETHTKEIISEQIVAQEVSGYSSDSVVELLKKSLNIHWQQTTALTAQAVHLERWGYKKLAAVIREDAEEEHQHASANIQRLEFFDVDYQPLIVSPPSWSRHDMLAILNYNLNSVREAAAAEKETIIAARMVGDEMTANMMIPLLEGSEKGIRLYESYLKLIEQMGIDNFLTLQA